MLYRTARKSGPFVLGDKMKEENTIQQFYSYYDTDKLSIKNELNTDDFIGDSFLLKIQLKRLPSDGETIVLCEVPNVLKISVMGLNKAKDEARTQMNDYEKGELLYLSADRNGYAPVIKTEIYTVSEEHLEWDMFSLSLPLNMYDAKNNALFLQYDGVCLRYLFNGEEVNAEYPFGRLKNPTGKPFVNREVLAAFGVTRQKPQTVTKSEILRRSIAFYSPRGYNTWAGDIVNFYKDGTYYLLCFFDRHHHLSRQCCGAHYMRLMTTRDFVHWVDHGPVAEVKEQWQTVGTGTMFFHKGKYYYCHGYHTGRMLPEEKLGSRILWKEYESLGYTTAHSYESIRKQGLFPNGANYVVSEDGVHFRPGNMQFHWAENPSIYTNDDGTLSMYCGFGTWKAEDIDGPWRLEDKNFPPSGVQTKMKNTAECPSFFFWNGYRYLMMGWTGFWQTENDSGKFIDSAALGFDIYDGLGVPMAVKTDDNRVIIGGWLYGLGWGSLIVHRELLQFENGRLGMRWLPECLPSPGDDDLVVDEKNIKNGDCFSIEQRRSYYMECEVDPEKDGAVAVGLSGEGEPCGLLLDCAQKTAEINFFDKTKVFDGKRILPPHILIEKLCGNQLTVNQLVDADLPCRAKNFCLANVQGIDKPFILKIIVHYERKTDSVFLDAEIAGVRTLVSNRVGLNVNEISLFGKNANFRMLKVFSLSE